MPLTDRSNLVLRLLIPLLLGALTACAAGPAHATPRPPAYPVPTGSVLLSAYNFDTPLAPTRPISKSHGWTIFQQAPGLVRSQTANPRPAHGRFEVVPGAPLVANGPRAQIRANPTLVDGTVTESCGRWYIPSYSDLPGPFHSWEMLYEEHPVGPASNPLFAHPPMALFVLGTKGRPYRLRLASGTGRRLDWQSGPRAFQPNTWHSFCVRSLWSPLRTGWVQLWIDGTWQKLENGRTRKYEVTMPSDRHYTEDGIYDGAGRANQQHSVTDMANIQIWSLPAS